VAEQFLTALAQRDFEAIEGLFHRQVRFRALVPSTVRQAADAREATNWLRRWFGAANSLELLRSSTGALADRLYLAYRLGLHDENGWQVVEQQAYLSVAGGQIEDIAILCSGLRLDTERQELPGEPESRERASLRSSRFAADAFYDAGDKGCAEGPLEEIARRMRGMQSGQTLEVHATEPSVAHDLPAWCRLARHQLVRREGDHYLLRRL
jgi:tRNA 2-thiouridine synthesizing protein A